MTDGLKTYILKIENDRIRIEYCYDGRKIDSEIKIAKSDIVVRLIDKANPLVEYLPESIRWTKIFKDKLIPLHPYYPFKFGELFNDFGFVAVENELLKLDLLNGMTIWSKKIANSNIKFLSKFDNGIIILYDHKDFDINKYYCNLKMVNSEGEVLWSAKPIDFLHNKLYDEVRINHGKIEVWSGSMYTTVDKNNGEIEQPQFVK